MKQSSGKTIFILINRSFLTRNILRCGTLDLLKQAGHSIVIFFAAKSVPEYLREEFEDDQVKIYSIKVTMNSRFRRLFNRMKRYIVITRNTKYNIRHSKLFQNEGLPNEKGIISRAPKALWRVIFGLSIAYTLSHAPFLKRILRWGEVVFFPEHNEKLKSFFDTYKPNLVFSTSSGGTFEYPFMKEAHRRGVATASMPKSWDNINNEFNPLIPDYFIVQNNVTKKSAIEIQKIPEEKISVVGMPHFDWYRKKEIIRSKEEHLKQKGLDPNRALIFFGSEGVWAPNDHLVAEQIYTWIKNDELVKPCQLLVRPHYSNVRDDIFKNLRGKNHIAVDSYRIVDFLIDKWDPNTEETIDFVNTVAHCDVMVSIASSLSLDAASMDKPAVTVGFGGEYVDSKDVTGTKLYSTDHIHWMMTSGGVQKADSPEELKKAINDYLMDSSLNQEERKHMIEKLCYKVDGQSSKRLATVLENALYSSN